MEAVGLMVLTSAVCFVVGYTWGKSNGVTEGFDMYHKMFLDSAPKQAREDDDEN